MSQFPHRLFSDLMRMAPFQPATNLWRAIELTFLIQKAFPLLQGMRTCVDLGCGDGQVMRLLKPHLPEDIILTGIDIDPEETFLAEQTHLYFKVHCASGDKLPLNHASQDVVISNSVLEHVEPIEGVLLEAGRILKNNGLFIATVPSDTFHACLKGAWMPFTSKENYNKTIDKRLAHLRYWNEAEWEEALGKAGMKLVHFYPYLTEKETQRWEVISRLTGGMLYMLIGKKKQPITIQRSLGMRTGRKLPKGLANIIAKICAYGVPAKETQKHGCVLVIGRKV